MDVNEHARLSWSNIKLRHKLCIYIYIYIYSTINTDNAFF
jgi:hypothetical protein